MAKPDVPDLQAARMRSLPPSPMPEQASGGGQRFLYGLLALIVVAGVTLRFEPQIAALAPGLGLGPAGATSQVQDPNGPNAIHGLVEAQALPASDMQAAVVALGLPAVQQDALIQAAQRRRLRLVRLPLFDIGGGSTVQVTAGGLTQTVALGHAPVLVTLPIDRAGIVSLQPVGASARSDVHMGAVTATGPLELEPVGPGQALNIGVVVQ
ncbi:hypothetical protein [Lichenicoccus roseus]|uniref:Uncharacterized protein n=1 Tax=Lichenicoccus roseus TaxID=2683649 RepID=A0A5R9J5T8_9PROT|nr:hypothetical protein [Lichenicoccus roseus]TLU72980.1 hypothetical protein FE263_05890 [Lichenicoccus roseus]